MKSLESYKKELENKIGVLVVICVLALLAVSFGNFFLKDAFPTKDVVNYYVIGFFLGVEVACLVQMGVYFKALKDENALKKMYTEENDEREIFIRMKSGYTVVPLFSGLILSASFAFAYISFEVFVALTIVAISQIIISFLLRKYWSKKI